jgi:hypothetical protein
MIYETRIVSLDNRPQIDPAIQLWMGSSRGRWDGDTLVVGTPLRLGGVGHPPTHV